MQEIRVDEAFWASSILPDGTVVRWLVADGAMVVAGGCPVRNRRAGEWSFDDCRRRK
jgi:hypothetical protein